MNLGYLKNAVIQAFNNGRFCTDYQNKAMGDGDYFEKMLFLSSHPAYGTPNCVVSAMVNYPQCEAVLLVAPDTKTDFRRHFEGAMKSLLSVTHYQRFVTVETSDGNTYYGGNGVILDENFQPLLVLYSEVRDRQFFSETMRVSSKIFTSKKMLERGIKNTLIPLVASMNNTHNLPEKIRVVIDDFPIDTFKKVDKPVNEYYSEDINDLLIHCVSELTDAFCAY